MIKSEDELLRAFEEFYFLSETDAKYMLDRVQTLAKSLNEPDRKPNDFAIARLLNEHAIGLFSLVADHNNLPDITAINRSYILVSSELKKLYARNLELKRINEQICWQNFDQLEYIHNNIWEYTSNVQGDYGQSHNAQVNRLCIINGKESPDLSPELKKIVDDVVKNGKVIYDAIEQNEPSSRNWYIPEYTFTYSPDGSLLINSVKGVLKVKKTQAGSASAKLLEQATADPNTLFKPNLGHNYSRSLSVTLSGLGFSGPIRELFFPTVSEDKGIIFRPKVNSIKASAEHIDTSKLDDKLKTLGAEVKQIPLSIEDIPF